METVSQSDSSVGAGSSNIAGVSVLFITISFSLVTVFNLLPNPFSALYSEGAYNWCRITNAVFCVIVAFQTLYVFLILQTSREILSEEYNKTSKAFLIADLTIKTIVFILILLTPNVGNFTAMLNGWLGMGWEHKLQSSILNLNIFGLQLHAVQAETLELFTLSVILISAGTVLVLWYLLALTISSFPKRIIFDSLLFIIIGVIILFKISLNIKAVNFANYIIAFASSLIIYLMMGNFLVSVKLIMKNYYADIKNYIHTEEQKYDQY